VPATSSKSGIVTTLTAFHDLRLRTAIAMGITGVDAADVVSVRGIGAIERLNT
jgi:hypothetical protein